MGLKGHSAGTVEMIVASLEEDPHSSGSWLEPFHLVAEVFPEATENQLMNRHFQSSRRLTEVTWQDQRHLGKGAQEHVDTKKGIMVAIWQMAFIKVSLWRILFIGVT